MRITFFGNFQVPYCSEVHHANTLEALGHEVIRIQEPQENPFHLLSKALDSDLFVWVHTHGWETPHMDTALRQLRESNIPTMTYHLDLWMGLQRQRDVRNGPYWELDHFFTVDQLMADYLNNNTPVKGHYLQAGVYAPECYIGKGNVAGDINTPDNPLGNYVLFVGSKGYHPEWPYRPQLIDWLANSYGEKFTHLGGGSDYPTVRGKDLNDAYASSKVVVGDSLCLNFDYPYYWSDRVYETLGRGGFLIHPFIKGMDNHFTDGKHLVFYDYGDFDQLGSLIDYYITHRDEREAIRLQGHDHVRYNHTYTQRWEHILGTLFGAD